MKTTAQASLESDDLAIALYTAYCKAYGGKDLPNPTILFISPYSEKQANAWREVAKMVLGWIEKKPD
jgi:hypothetical protein